MDNIEEEEAVNYLPITSSETLRNCSNLDVNNTPTLFIASYPKSGTTW
jgi:hypothetical protein